MKRRAFLGSILAAGVAPAIVRADSLMRIIVPSAFVLRPMKFAIHPGWPSPATCDLTEASLEEVLIEISKFTESSSERIAIKPARFWIPA